jgi:CheY-like chemotaxis protein
MRSPTILLADADSRTVYALMLEHHGFRVLHAPDGAEALHLMDEQRPDLMVLDLFLPLVDGSPLAALIRRDPRTAALPVIALSALPTAVALPRGLQLCDQHLTKPCTPSRLLGEVRRMLE